MQRHSYDFIITGPTRKQFPKRSLLLALWGEYANAISTPWDDRRGGSTVAMHIPPTWLASLQRTRHDTCATPTTIVNKQLY